MSGDSVQIVNGAIAASTKVFMTKQQTGGIGDAR
jgi:hypothetical protein